MDCPNCGYNEVPQSARFCPNCGEEMQQAGASSTEISVVQESGA